MGAFGVGRHDADQTSLHTVHPSYGGAGAPVRGCDVTASHRQLVATVLCGSAVVVGALPPQHGGGAGGRADQQDAGDPSNAGGGLVGAGDPGHQ